MRASCSGGGYGLVKFTAAETTFDIEEMWAAKKPLAAWLLRPVLLGDHVYLCLSRGRLTCIELNTVRVAAEGDIRLGQCSLTYADGRRYLRSRAGKVALVAASPIGFQIRGMFDPPRPSKEEPSGVFLVVAHKRLYLRDMDMLLCYDVREPGSTGVE
jgi:outer membrane protein assembly factor BamB